MDRVTVIVVPNETEPVRRLQVPRALLRHGWWVAVLVAAAVTAGTVDWVRLRVDAVDVARLRAESEHQRDRLTELAQGVRSVEEDLARIREFERKVRVIADLPESIAEVTAPRLDPARHGDGEQGLPSGPAGGETPFWELGSDELPQLGSAWTEQFDPAIAERLGRRMAELSDRVESRGGSLEDLIEGLHGKSHQLASTPSIWPTDGWVTSAYGYRTSPFTGRRKFHSGLDIAADAGTPVVAPARGKVVYVGRKGPLGRTVTLDHGYGMRTTYGHTSEIFVELGQEVERGERIAAVGSTGRSTGPHLHYAVLQAGKSVDPSDYILE